MVVTNAKEPNGQSEQRRAEQSGARQQAVRGPAAMNCSRTSNSLLAGTALFGSALLTLAIGFLGVRYDHRLLLISSAGLMAATGVALSIVESYALLLVVAFIGSVNPSGGSASSFVPVEHAVLTRETADAERTKAFARYS